MSPLSWEPPLDAHDQLVAAGWVPVVDSRDHWRDPADGSRYPTWRALELMRRDALRTSTSAQLEAR